MRIASDARVALYNVREWSEYHAGSGDVVGAHIARRPRL